MFAIAATLLILNVAAGGPNLGHELVRIWPSYAGYAISFITIGIIWSNHHTMISQLRHVNRTFLMLNVLFLMLIAFIPFPTRLLAENIRSDGAQAAAVAYGVTMTLTAILFNVLWRYAAAGGRLLRDDANPRVVQGIGRSYLPGPVLYLTATLVAFINPLVGAALYAVIAAFYVFESSVYGGRD